MLSRTADHLYWMSRYIERAESLARLVDAHYRMSMLPHSGDTLTESLQATMTALHMAEAYHEKHDKIEPRAVFEFVSLDRDYSGSIFSCLRAARENARAVRGSLTSELWVTLNSTWLDARDFSAHREPHADIGQFVEWVKERSHLTRGVTIGTMLRDEAFHFTRIGAFLERADSTARILTAHQNDLHAGCRRGRGAGPLSMERAAARALGVRNLPACLPRRHHAAQGRAAADPARRHAALLAALLQGGLHEPAVGLESAIGRDPAPRRRDACDAAFHTHGGHHGFGVPLFLEQFLARSRDLGDRIASDFLVPPAEA
jgi:uncharacterized alpha-E superfamily protein